MNLRTMLVATFLCFGWTQGCAVETDAEAIGAQQEELQYVDIIGCHEAGGRNWWGPLGWTCCFPGENCSAKVGMFNL